MTTITVEVLEKFFLWMTIINFGILTLYFLLFLVARDFIYKLHTTWFKMTEGKISSSLYKTFAFYKITVIIFNLVPYIALRIIDGK